MYVKVKPRVFIKERANPIEELKLQLENTVQSIEKTVNELNTLKNNLQRRQSSCSTSTPDKISQFYEKQINEKTKVYEGLVETKFSVEKNICNLNNKLSRYSKRPNMKEMMLKKMDSIQESSERGEDSIISDNSREIIESSEINGQI